MKKSLYTMRIGNYAPDICELTYPLLKHWARKLGAEFVEITERKYPDWPIPYETFQLYELMKERDDDWCYWIDADALVNPETPDWTAYMTPDMCCQNGTDPGPIRWRQDEYFRRDGRRISSCNWHAIVPRDCRDFFRPLDDLTFPEVVDRISIIISEARGHCAREHLVSDYTVSRNIARFGLKYKTLMQIQRETSEAPGECYFHLYAIPKEERKVDQLLLTLARWFGGLRAGQHFMQWEPETLKRLEERLAVARLRAEQEMFYEAAKAALSQYKEKEIGDNAQKYVVGFVQEVAKQNGGTVPGPSIAHEIERMCDLVLGPGMDR